MRRIRFTESQILNILKEVESGLLVKDVCRNHSIAPSTYFSWKAKYSGMTLPDIKKLRELEEENRRLKKMYADLALENHALKDVLEKKF